MINESGLILFRDLPNPLVPQLKTFKFVKSNYLGVFNKSAPFIYFDDFVARDLVESAQQEIKLSESILKQNSKLLSVNGIVPSEVNGGVKSLDSLLMHLENYMSTEQLQHFSKLKYLSELKEYINSVAGQKKNWDLFVHLRQYSGFDNKNNGSDWLPFMKHLPALKALIESLPFEKVGYAVLFYSNPCSPVYIHRDIFPREHDSTFISIDLNLKPREFFIYDALKKEKICKSKNHYSFMFNESDLHGAEPDPQQHVTLRIQGSFSQEFKKAIGIDGQKAFSWTNDRAQDLLLKNYEILDKTDC